MAVRTMRDMNRSKDNNKDELNLYGHNKQLQAQVNQLQIMVANLVNISTEYNEYKQSASAEMASMCHKLHDKSQLNGNNKAKQYEYNKRLQSEVMQLQIMVDALKNENDNLKQENMTQNEYGDKLQKKNNEMKQTIDEHKTLQNELLNIIDEHNDYKEVMEDQLRERNKLIQRLQKMNNEELLDQYSNQLNEFQTMVIDIRNTKRELSIENDIMKRILSDHDLYPPSSNIVAPNLPSNDKLTDGQTNTIQLTQEKQVETETLIEKQEELKQQQAPPPKNNGDGCCVVL